MTVRDLIKRSLRLIGAVASGETATASEQADALTALNAMLGSWSVSGLLVYEIAKENLTLVAGQQVYTIGSGGDFDTARPVVIKAANILENLTEYPVDVVNYQQWAALPYKTNTSNIPNKLYLETSYPLAKINLYPIPNVGNTLILYSLKPITSFASANDTITLPDGYEDALAYNLAMRIAPEFGKVLSGSDIEKTAIETKYQISRANSRELLMSSDLFALVPKKFNIYEGVS